MKTIGEVTRKTGIPFWKIIYAEQTGKIPPIPRIAGRRVFDEKLIATDTLQKYMDSIGYDVLAGLGIIASPTPTSEPPSKG